MVVSAADKTIYVYRNGNPIGRAPLEISGRGSLGNHVFQCSKARTGRLSSLVPGRQARQWMSVTSSGRSVDAERSRRACESIRSLRAKVYDMFAPGTTVIITDQPVVRSRANAAILEG